MTPFRTGTLQREAEIERLQSELGQAQTAANPPLPRPLVEAESGTPESTPEKDIHELKKALQQLPGQVISKVTGAPVCDL